MKIGFNDLGNIESFYGNFNEPTGYEAFNQENNNNKKEMELFFKTTVWERIKLGTVPEGAKRTLINAIKEGKCSSADECFGIHPEIDSSYEVMLDTSEQMSLEDNGGNNTIELMDDDNNLIWGNGNK